MNPTATKCSFDLLERIYLSRQADSSARRQPQSWLPLADRKTSAEVLMLHARYPAIGDCSTLSYTKCLCLPIA